MPKHYAIVSFRSSGPLKSWSAVRAAHIHNHRVKELAHTAPAGCFRYIPIGTADLVDDVRKGLVRHGIDPDRGIRADGVIAYECVLTASHAYFHEGDEAAQAERLKRWIVAQRKFVTEKYGEHRVVSMVLHMDEITPHFHVIILPLVYGRDGRRADQASTWRLCGRVISGPGEFSRLQDEYAEAMRPLGLHRGERGKGVKHKPVARYMAEIEAARAELAQQAADLQRERAMVQAAKQAAEDERAKQEALTAQLLRDEFAFRKARGEFQQARKLLQERAAMVERMLEEADTIPREQIPISLRAWQRKTDQVIATFRPAPELPANVPADVRDRMHINRVKFAHQQWQRGPGIG